VVEIASVIDEGLGHASHVIGLADGRALVIDPARSPAAQRRIAIERGWRIAWTADTHSHADYISGSPELAADGAVFLASAGAGLAVPHAAVCPDDELDLGGGASVRAIATPGHTPVHLAYLLLDDGAPVALFSGGSLMVGTVGRTDLLGGDRRDELARLLFRSLRAEVLSLPDDVIVYPTHGAGSFCSAPVISSRTTTIGRERTTNPLLAIDDEDTFVEQLLSGLGSFPRYYAELPERNRRGTRRYSQLPTLRRLDVEAVGRALTAVDAVVVDARPIGAFAEAHLPGSISIAHRPVFGPWLGWLVELDEPIVFVLDDTSDRADIVRQALTVGHEHLLGELDEGIDAWRASGRGTASIPLVDPHSMATNVLDVRQRAEWVTGHLPGASHVELGALGAAALPDGPLTVMCGHGERAMSAASLLAGRGHDDVSVLDGGPAEWSRATGRSLEVAS
jgi:hydroxyacylglutathione hydrolase